MCALKQYQIWHINLAVIFCSLKHLYDRRAWELEASQGPNLSAGINLCSLWLLRNPSITACLRWLGCCPCSSLCHAISGFLDGFVVLKGGGITSKGSAGAMSFQSCTGCQMESHLRISMEKNQKKANKKPHMFVFAVRLPLPSHFCCYCCKMALNNTNSLTSTEREC